MEKLDISSLNEGQKDFLKEAEHQRIDTKLFNKYVPEIKYQEEKPDTSKPTIAYVHTGGTLMMVKSKTESDAI